MTESEMARLTAEELDKLPIYSTGLPKNPQARRDALAAWRMGGAKGLNQWRVNLDRQRESNQ